MVKNNFIDSANTQQRLDQWLYFARLFKTRTLANKHCSGRKIKVNNQLINKSSYNIKINDIIEFTKDHHDYKIQIKSLIKNRIPFAIAEQIYDNQNPRPIIDKSDPDQVTQYQIDKSNKEFLHFDKYKPSSKEKRQIKKFLNNQNNIM